MFKRERAEKRRWFYRIATGSLVAFWRRMSLTNHRGQPPKLLSLSYSIDRLRHPDNFIPCHRFTAKHIDFKGPVSALEIEGKAP